MPSQRSDTNTKCHLKCHLKHGFRIATALNRHFENTGECAIRTLFEQCSNTMFAFVKRRS